MSRSGWVATASATGGTNVAANAIDGNPSTRWSPGVNQASGQYFQVDMLSPRTFVELSLATAPFPTDYPRAFQVSVSNDGTNFGTPIATGSGTATPTTISFAPQTARFVRVTLTATAANLWSIADFDVITTTLPRTGWFATATSTSGSNAAANALDGVATTKWTSAGAQTAQSFQVDMAARQTFSQLTLDSGSSANNFPRSYSVFVSNDWANFGSPVATGTATASPVIINLPTQFAQYIKITAGTNAASWTIAELTVNGQPTVQTTLPRSGWTATASSTSSTTTTAGALDGNAATRWSSAGAQTGQSFTVDMLALRTFNQITLDAGTTSTQYPRHYALFVSNDGVNFGSAVGSGTVSGALAVMNPPTQTARYLKIVQDATNTNPWSIQELNVFGPSVAQSGWNATASSTGGTDLASNAIDGMAGTRWTSAGAQSNGQTFQVDLGAAQIFNQITLDAGTSTGNYPRGYSVSVSADGTTFGAPVATGVGSSQVVTINFATTTARAIRITQTGTAANAWSIHELNVARIAQPCDTATCTASDTCHAGICDPNTGLCSSQLRPDGQACNDGNVCTVGETCRAGSCQPPFATTCTGGPNITFYQSYENETTVDIAATARSPQIANPLTHVAGAFGRGIDSVTTFELGYATNVDANPTNFALSKPGSLSMWIKPNENFSGAFLFRGYDNTVDRSVDLGATSTNVNVRFMTHFLADTILYTTAPWTAEQRWHLLVVNWSRTGGEVSVDGAAPVPATFSIAPPTTVNPALGNLIYAGGGDGPGFSKDEVLVLNRPMTNAEIQAYYQLGKAGGLATPNPIIAQLNASSTACNFFDDLNPCTADSCNPTMGTMGVTSVPVPDGTPCSDANMCNGAETCHSGVCVGSAPVVCAATQQCRVPGTCDPATGTCLAPTIAPDAAACEDGDECTVGDACTAGNCTKGTLDSMCAVEPRFEGIVTVGGKKRAVFSYKNRGPSEIYIGYGDHNNLSAGAQRVQSPPTPPPLWFQTDDHVAVFAPEIETATLSWKLGTHTATATATAPPLTPMTEPEGTGVIIGETFYLVEPNMEPFREPPAEPSLADDPFDHGAELWHGRLKGEFSVSPTGAATYDLKIAMPPGIAGMVPNLSLAYNSQSGQGIAGHGWDLAGLSNIHRCPRERATDGVHRALDMGSLIGPSRADENTDGLCLDGKHLFLRSRDDSKQVYTYEAELSDLTVITYYPRQNRFTAITKSGETRNYGSRQRVTLTERDHDVDVIWPLDRVTDTWGNYYDLVYNGGQADFEEKGLLLTDVYYTGHLIGSDQPEVATPFEHVTLSYEFPSNGDQIRNVRFRGAALRKIYWLKTITTSAGSYDLTYRHDPSGIRPIELSVITYCATGGAPCAEPLQFLWDDHDYGWDQSADWALPTSIKTTTSKEGWFFPRYVRRYSGSQFVDLDRDGRPDLVRLHGAYPNATWRNTGSGWAPAPDAWTIPDGKLVNSNGQAAGSMFADMDGDGRPDFVDNIGGSFRVWLNRIDPAALGSGVGWIEDFGYDSPMPVDLNKDDALIDMNGDGRADLVRVTRAGNAGHDDKIHIFLNRVPTAGMRSSAWFEDPAYNPSWWTPNVHVQDMDGDGLPDIVMVDEQPAQSTTWVALNTGDQDIDGDGTVYVDPDHQVAVESNLLNKLPKGQEANGEHADVDGDGTLDVRLPVQNLPGLDLHSVVLGTGMGGIDIDGLGGLYLASSLRSNFDHFLDLNADGLADGVFDSTTKSPFVNLGYGWATTQGAPGLPTSLAPEAGAAVVDLDGDGVPDVAFGDSFTAPGKAWLNRYRKPRIGRIYSGRNGTGFGTSTYVSYVSITQADARSRSGALPPVYEDSFAGVMLPDQPTPTILPLTVVKSVKVDNGVGGNLESTYHYKNLRAMAGRRMPMRGFGQITTIDSFGVRTDTTYGSVMPYVGLPLRVARSNVSVTTGASTGPLSETVTTLCDQTDPQLNCFPSVIEPSTRYLPGIAAFAVPRRIVETTYLRRSASPETIPAEKIVTTTEFEYDRHRNPRVTTVTMERFAACNTTPQGCVLQERRKSVATNEYQADPSESARMGKPKSTTVRNIVEMPAGIPDRQHRTEFRYDYVSSYTPDPAVPDQLDVPALALVTTIAEPGGGEGVELHTVQTYDRFGNVIISTSCASDLEHCGPGLPGPATLPYRTTTVSYDPAAFNRPSGAGLVSSLPYGPGRFPVMTMNGALHKEYRAYDPKLGKVIQQTGPNGVHTCWTYDTLGELKQEVNRCGSENPLVTSNDRYLAMTVQYPPGSFTVTVRRAPTGERTWTFSDILDRKVGTWSRGFGGELIETRTTYDSLGRIDSISKPAFISWDGPLDWTINHYDTLGRLEGVDEPLGVIDSSGSRQTSHVTITYGGSKVETTRTVAGAARRHVQTKNVIGKVSSVTDDGDAGLVRYSYDADGNLTDTIDPSGNDVHITYDVRSRKQISRDPDMGEWHYDHDAFGDLVYQRDAKSQETTMSYDALGRLVSKTEKEAGQPDGAKTSQWVYDLAPGGGIGRLAAMVSPADDRAGPCDVPYVTSTAGSHAGRWFEYSRFGELVETFECVDSVTYQTTRQYDTGRLQRLKYPAIGGERLTIDHHYTRAGYLQYVSDATDNGIYWSVTEMNALGQITKQKTRNGVESIASRNNTTGWLMGETSTAHADGDTTIQKWDYGYDEAGNLRRRQRTDRVNAADSVETFEYDPLDRLKKSEVQSGGSTNTERYDYDELGNVVTKGANGYTYGSCGAGPHAVCTVGGSAPFAYDLNGSMTAGRDRTVKYNLENKPSRIEKSGKAVDFVYGADGVRVLQIATADGTTRKTSYVGLNSTGSSLYERTTLQGAAAIETEHAQYLYPGGGPAFALRTVNQSSPGAVPSPPVMKYYHRDHLGSVTAMSDELGRVAEATLGGRNPEVLGYDAWGTRRTPEGSPLAPGSVDDPAGRRTYTGQETLSAVGLMNMNGRVYDPELGRFLSADPLVQLATNLQSYNRYSYVLNNPLRYTDPTGHATQLQEASYVVGWVTVNIGPVVGVAVCAAFQAACIPYQLSLAGTIAAMQLASGAAWDQVLISTAVGVGGSLLGGALGGAAVGEINSAGQAMMYGAISGATSAAVQSVATDVIADGDFDGDNLGTNILAGIASGALVAGATYGIQNATLVSDASVAQAQGGPAESPNCNMRCKAAIEKALGENPFADEATGSVYFELTGEQGEGKYEGLLKARLRPWVVDRVQRIFDEYHLDYDVGSTALYVGGDQSHSPAYGVIQLASPGEDPGGSFARTGRSLLHEFGHQAQMATIGGAKPYENFMSTWKAQKSAYTLPGAYERPGALEYEADQFANMYLPRILR